MKHTVKGKYSGNISFEAIIQSWTKSGLGSVPYREIIFRDRDILDKSQAERGVVVKVVANDSRGAKRIKEILERTGAKSTTYTGKKIPPLC